MKLEEYFLACYPKETALWLYSLSKIKLTKEQLNMIKLNHEQYKEKHNNSNFPM